jgi:hypothetical protein
VNKVQTEHLNSILERTRELLTAKYVKGAKEHDSVLSEDYTALELCDFAIEEALDQITYLLTLRDKLELELREEE